MFLRKRILELEKRIKARTDEITKEKILAYNKENFDLFFNSDDNGDYCIFIHPRECVKPSENGKECGYIYQGLYKPSDNGAILLGIRIYESDNVVFEQGNNVYKNLKIQKNKRGEELFTLDELVEFDAEHVGLRICDQHPAQRISQRNNKIQAAKDVLGNAVLRCWNNLKNKQM